jgi:type IV pilus assembly protein PilO
MTPQELVAGLQNFDFEQLNDFNNVGSWPLAIKIIMWLAVFGVAVTIGYVYHVTNLQKDLTKAQTDEIALREDYAEKWEKAVHLDGYRIQKVEMEESFGALLEQLPSDTEIPGLIEDITLSGLESGLSIFSIDLKPEVMHEFYIEKPIDIVVSGGYHELGAFVSDVADLSRIVTLQDFTIAPAGASANRDGESGKTGLLTMSITAKTYRYNDTSQ